MNYQSLLAQSLLIEVVSNNFQYSVALSILAHAPLHVCMSSLERYIAISRTARSRVCMAFFILRQIPSGV